jgi:hypothetical protein
MEIIIPIYRNYNLVYKQIYHYSLQTNKDWTILFCDNTPHNEIKTIPFDNIDLMALRSDITSDKYASIKDRIKWSQFNEIDGIDGERHGSTLDYMVKQATTEYIGIQDSDFFWIDEQIIDKALNYFNLGYQAVGAELFYDDFGYVNDIYPGRAGWKAPCVFATFTRRDYLLDKTFICTQYEGHVCKRETGWKVRQAMIDDGLRMIVFHAGKSMLQDGKSCFKSWLYLGVDYPAKVIGFHLIQGSESMMNVAEQSHANLLEIAKHINSRPSIKLVNKFINVE